jgi:peptidoglycan/xylan/chitin deacetylase (PgdA/CDA1 family)
MYHHVLPKSSFIASSVDEFESQMEFLADNGYKTLTSQEFLDFKKGKNFPKKSVFITFDDGWRDNFFYAYPILKKYNLKATLFLITDWIEQASKAKANFTPLNHKECKKTISTNPHSIVLNWDEIEQMSDVFDYHSHTHSHRDFYFGKEYSWEEEFEISKEILKNRLGINPNQLCWPRGQYDENLIKLAKNYFEILYTTNRGTNTSDNELLEIKRLSVKKDEKWLKKQLFIFNNKILGNIYSKVKK